MTTTTEILKSLTPYFPEIRQANLEDKQTALQKKIMILATKISDAGKVPEFTLINGFKLVNTHLSLNLSDFKTALECKNTAPLIIKYLNLSQNIDKINELFPFVDRIQKTADSILESISLREVQMAGFVVPVRNSCIWFALVPDSEFLKRQVSDLEKISEAASVLRMQHIVEKNPGLIIQYQKTPFKKPFFGGLELSFGKLPHLLKEEIESVADRMPVNACRLFSDKQIIPLKFSLFTGEKLDSMIEGNGRPDEIKARLLMLNHKQMEEFLKKSSGLHFDKFSDIFYKTLRLSKLKKETIALLFANRPEENLPLVPTDEVRHGLHLLPHDILRFLSAAQIVALNYAKMSGDEFRAVFCHHMFSLEKKQYKLSLIPPLGIYNVLKLEPAIIEMLSKEQYLMLDTHVLNETEVKTLFPGFTIETIFDGFTHTKIKGQKGQLVHRFEFNTKSGSALQSFTEEKLNELLDTEKNKCMTMLDNFSLLQLQIMQPMMYKEVQDLLKIRLANVFVQSSQFQPGDVHS